MCDILYKECRKEWNASDFARNERIRTAQTRLNLKRFCQFTSFIKCDKHTHTYTRTPLILIV